ncbi:uncharacterized protein [Asterias amurensis]|uniref:uncharacterized protein n=1 Tax=Asterias amurensis TaxID=7602 RepID=UPI003AB47A12
MVLVFSSQCVTGTASMSRHRRGEISGHTCTVDGKTYDSNQVVPDINSCKKQCRCYASLFGRTGHVVCAVNRPCKYTNLCVNPIVDDCGCPKCQPGGGIWTLESHTVLLSENRPAWQTSTQSYRGLARGARLAVDGVTDGGFFGRNSCTHTARHFQPWWKVDLGKSFVVSRVVIFNRNGVYKKRLIGALVRVGDSGVIFRNQPCGTIVRSVDVERNQKITRVCKPDTRGRSVSVQLQKRRQYLTLCEVQVYGYEIPGQNGAVKAFGGYPPIPSNLPQTPGYPAGFIPGSSSTGGNCFVPDPQNKQLLVIPDGGITLLGSCAKCSCKAVSTFASAKQVTDRGCECDYSGCCEYQGKHYALNEVVPNYEGNQCSRLCKCLPVPNGGKPVIACSANSNVCNFESRCVHYELDNCGCPFCQEGVSDCWGFDPWTQKDVCVPDGHGQVVINPEHPDYVCMCMYVVTIQVSGNTVIPHNKLRRAKCGKLS